jgi:hypothetical protein
MARYEDAAAAEPVCEAEVARRLAGAAETRRMVETVQEGRLLARWEIDVRTGRPFCRWVLHSR